jgi:hypothetical protein
MGMLEKLHSCQKPEELIQTLHERTLQYHGAVGVEYLRLLVRDRKELSESIRRLILEFPIVCRKKATDRLNALPGGSAWWV